MTSLALTDIVNNVQVLPVLTVTSPSQAVNLCQALYQGGIQAVEITLRTEAALAALAQVKQALPQLIVSAGTVCTPEQVNQVADIGVDFGVSPAATANLLNTIKDRGLPFIPGVATPSEAMFAAELGFNHAKLFPATAVGGLKLLKSLAAPLPHLKFCPTGGLNQENFIDFLQLPNVFCVGGSWMVDAELLKAEDWNGIAAAARRVTDALEG